MDLRQAIKDKIAAIGPDEARKFFGVSLGTISNWATDKTAPTLAAAQLIANETQSQVEAKPLESVQPMVTWEGKKLFVMLPALRTVNADTHYTLFANYARYGAEKLGMEVRKGTAIWEARNILAHNFMNNTDCETGLMCDDDMILPTGDQRYLNGVVGAGLPPKMAGELAFSRIMSHGKDKGVIGALYFGRHGSGRAQCASAFVSDVENRKLHEFKYEGLKAEKWVGTGLIKIERWVFQKMKDAIDAGQFPECKPHTAGGWYGYFNPTKVGHGEDVCFGLRCGELGIQSYVDTGLICIHEGPRGYGPVNTRDYKPIGQ